MVAKCMDINSEEYLLGQRIRRIRLAKGLTQNALADLMDMERANIANYENGTKGEMGFKTLMKFSAALEVPVDALLNDKPGEDMLGEKISRLNEESRSILGPVVDGLLLRQRTAV